MLKETYELSWNSCIKKVAGATAFEGLIVFWTTIMPVDTEGLPVAA